uniref:BZIP domain-containing protein n=1 Tax=Ascaris lumbricoides TaxID=6252 RepID=A0A9J2P4V5_ASCLU
MAADIHSTLGSGASRYEHQLKAMSMCWQAFDPSTTYPSAAYPTQSAAGNAFQVPAIKNDQQVAQQLHQHHLASFAHQLSSFSFTPSPSSTPSKKKATPVPDDLKDEAYRERRMKNNESARKSREMRRQKEESTQRRCDQLLHENNLLRAELSILRNQVEHFKRMLSMTTSSQSFGAHTQLP